MPQTKYVEINNGIKKRFYEAIVRLMELHALRGRQTYCNLAGIDKRNFYAQEADITILRMQLYWLVPLVTDFGVNARWLLTGRGEMFDAEPAPKQRKQRATMYPKPTNKTEEI